MRIPRSLFIISVALLTLRAEKDVCAQWKNIAPNLVSPISNAGFGYGAMQYKEGKIIAVVFGTPICVSSDEGKTWQLVKAPYQRDEPFDLDMFDNNNAIITTYSSGLFKSQDGGLTWVKTSLQSSLKSKSGKFLQSANDIVAGLYYSDLTVSHDGGITWNQISNFGSQNDVQVRKKDHTIFALSNGQIYFTNNEGNTWTRTSAFSQDCYNFAFDNCDSNALYVMNEGTVSAGINLGANIFSSFDNGVTFTSTKTMDGKYFCGNITSAPGGTLYVQTHTTDGVIRSTDQGKTWKSIGGPSGFFDSRQICCKDDNTIFVIDTFGSVWVTYNSGGDSLTSIGKNSILTISQKTLFLNDTALCTSISRFATFSTSGCVLPGIIKSEIVGQDSSSYSMIPISGDSIVVTCNPKITGQLNADLVLTLSNGTFDTITLQGFGVVPHPLSLSTANQSTDTIGNSAVYVPITISGLDHAEDIELVLLYDNALKYSGSFSLTNSQLDMPNEGWSGRSKLHIAGAKPNEILGYARFNVFGDSLKRNVRFDSVTVLTAIAPCQYISPAPVTSTITPPSGCGIQTLTRYMLDSTLPTLRIVPNPTSGEISITSSGDLGAVNVAVYDMLGAKQNESIATMQKNSPTKIMLPAANGMYNVRVRSGERTFDLRVVVSR